MTVEGQAVHRTLSQTLAKLRGQVATNHDQAQAAAAQQTDLLNRRGEALLTLARHYLPEISRETVQNAFTGVRADLQGVLNRQEQKQQELSQKLSQLSQTIASAQADLKQLTAQLDAKVQQREALQKQLAEKLAADADFQARSKLALQAEELLHQNEQRVADVRREADEKLPAYERSDLFVYLRQRQYGTSGYRGRGLFRTLDRWVAGLIDYSEVRRGAEFLSIAPKLMAAELDRRRESFNQLMSQVEARQAERSAAIGLTDVLREGTELGGQRDSLVQQLASLADERKQVETEVVEVANTHGSFYQQALQRYCDFLSHARGEVLQSRAAQTPEAEDDAIVADLVQLDQQLQALRARQEQAQTDTSRVEQQAGEIERVLRDFVRKNYDSGRSYFRDGFDVSELLEQFVRGAIPAQQLASLIAAAQKFRPNWTETTGAQIGTAIASPEAQILLNVLLQSASAALQGAAQRGVQRRGSDFGIPPQRGDFPLPPMNLPASMSSGRSHSSGGGGGGGGGGGSSGGSFTSGEGF